MECFKLKQAGGYHTCRRHLPAIFELKDVALALIAVTDPDTLFINSEGLKIPRLQSMSLSISILLSTAPDSAELITADELASRLSEYFEFRKLFGFFNTVSLLILIFRLTGAGLQILIGFSEKKHEKKADVQYQLDFVLLVLVLG